jgi:glycosyltransferase involved in cell wall biosynthesis
MARMHLAIICEEFPPSPHGGTGSSYGDLARSLADAGHRVTVVGVATTEKITRARVDNQNGVLVHRLPRATPSLGARLGAWEERWRLRRRLRRIHRDQPLDLVESSDYHGWLSGGSGIRGLPMIIRIRGSNLFFDAELDRVTSPVEKLHERAALGRATHLASVSRYAANRTLEVAGLAGRPCEVIPNAVDTEWFCPGDEGSRVPGLILFLNSIGPRKGIAQLLAACNILFPRFPEANLAIVGGLAKGDTGTAYRRELERLVLPQFRHRVAFDGRVPRNEVRTWLRRASVCCYPSLMETFGIAPLEAMSTGRPTIFTRLGPGPEIIDHGRTGLLCDPRDPADIASSLEQLLSHPDNAEAMGQRARIEVQRRFGMAAWTARNLSYFQRCLDPDLPFS